jgi:hypothetical protein
MTLAGKLCDGVRFCTISGEMGNLRKGTLEKWGAKMEDSVFGFQRLTLG